MYIDVLMLLNFGVDFLLLHAADRLCGYPGDRKRTIFAALLGGVYGGICIIPLFRWMGGFVGRGLCLGVISGIAFGFRRESLRRMVLFIFLTMALGGISLAFGKSGFWAILVSAVAVVLMCVLGFHGKAGAQYVPVIINGEMGTVRFLALRDTGNTLIDPITGKEVLVASSGIGMKLLGISGTELCDPVGAVSKIPGTRLIPYHAVGTEGGMLLARKFDDVTIGSWTGSCLVAFVPHELGRGEPYEALTGGV